MSISLSVSSLQRHRVTICAVAAIAAVGLSFYYASQSEKQALPSQTQLPGLHRSNAQRRQRPRVARIRERAQAVEDQPGLNFLNNEEASQHIHGWHTFRLENGEHRTFPLYRDVLEALYSAADAGFNSSEAAQAETQLEDSFLNLYLFHHLRHRRISPEQRSEIINALEQSGFSEGAIEQALDNHRGGHLRELIDAWVSDQARDGRSIDRIVIDQQIQNDWIREHHFEDNNATVEDSESERSWSEGSSSENETQDGRNLLRLLFCIADEQHRRDGFVHRGITCNSCGGCPIRGIRYRCTNCADYDLCEVCEAQQVHYQTHLFYKVRIPRSRLGHQPQPVKYPNNMIRRRPSLPRRTAEQLARRTGFKYAEIEGSWEQFQCHATAKWSADPYKIGMAIDRRNFEQLLFPTDATRPPAPNLIYDRVFSFYDTDNNDLIGFDEFLDGLSCLNKKGPQEKWKRVFRGFDLDGDGFVDRKDFLRMFKAHYTLTKDMLAELIANIEDDGYEDDARVLIEGGQPISSGFAHSSPQGQPSRAGHGKSRNRSGEDRIHDGGGIVDDDFPTNLEDIVAQRAEQKEFGHIVSRPDNYKAKHIRDIVKEIYESAWPPIWVELEDLEEVSIKGMVPADIHNIDQQDAIRRACHQRWAWDWQKRHFVRRQAIKDREKRKFFFENVATAFVPQDDAAIKSYESLIGAISAGALLHLDKGMDSDSAFQDFIDRLEELIEPLDWCVERVRLRSCFCILIDMGWNGSEIAESFQGYTLDDASIERFVTQSEQLVREYLPFDSTSPEGAFTSSVPRRSRSSSKVRFEDDLEPNAEEHETRSATSLSSRSIPVNERWGGHEIPAPYDDYGREILYQVTEEALNELVDPLLKAREDLWLEARATKSQRERYRSLICETAFVPKYDHIQRCLTSFLKQCHLKENYPPAPGSWARDTRSEAATFREFVRTLESRIRNDLTSEKCPNCSDARVYIGWSCESCGTRSSAAQASIKEQHFQNERCSLCARKGTLSRLRQDLHCAKCRLPSRRILQEQKWLWKAVSNSDEFVDTKVQELMDTCNRNYTDWQTGQSSWKSVSTIEGENSANFVPPQSQAGEPTPDLSIGETTPSADSHINPITPADFEQAPNHPVMDSTDSGEAAAAEFPSMALALHDSVRAFEDGVDSVEQPISQKPLEELLEQSGYSIMEDHNNNSSSSSSTQPRDTTGPTPTQILPDPSSSSSSSASSATVPPYPPNQTYEFTTPLTRDPTLPQFRPTSISSHSPHKRPEQGPPDEGTLRYWAALTILEADDEQRRGGPGRLNEQEFLDIMLGERGRTLEFIGDWMNLTTF